MNLRIDKDFEVFTLNAYKFLTMNSFYCWDIDLIKIILVKYEDNVGICL